MILTIFSDSGKKKENDHALSYKEISLEREGPFLDMNGEKISYNFMLQEWVKTYLWMIE